MDLLARYAPEFDRSARHATDVRADVPTVVASIRETNFGQSRVVRVLLERIGDAALLDVRGAAWARGLTLDALAKAGCVLLVSHDPREMALGAIVTMSTVRPALLPGDAQTFATFARPNSVKVLWHFSVASNGEKLSTLTLETRVRGNGGPAACRLLRHWDTFARLGTLARREVVAAIKGNAEVHRFDCARSGNCGTNRRPERPETPPWRAS